MKEKRMELEQRKLTMRKIKLFYAIWNGIMIMGGLCEINQLPYMGIADFLGVIVLLILWNYVPTTYILYIAKVAQMYPGITIKEILFQDSIIYNIFKGYGLKRAIEFRILWIKCLLIVPMLKEFADDNRRLELQAAATEASETPKFADL